MRKPPRPLVTFEDVYAEHAERVLRLVLLLGVPFREHEDVAQEVWIAVFRNLDDVEPGKVPAWVAAIVRYRVHTWRDTRQRRSELSTPLDPSDAAELTDSRTPESELDGQRRQEAAQRFLAQAIPDEGRREALLFYEVLGLTYQQIAENQGVSLYTVQWRLTLARRELKKAMAKASDKDREKLGAAVVFTSVDEVLEALRTKRPEDEVVRVWERVQKRIALEGGTPGERNVADSAPPADLPPRPFVTLTGPEAAITGGGLFGVGAITGAAVVLALLSRPPRDLPSLVGERYTAPAPTAEQAPMSPASAAPSATSSAAAVTGSAELADALLVRVSTALVSGAPAEALRLLDEHARRFPGTKAAKREDFTIQALLQLGKRAEAEERAEKLVKWAPAYRAEMEALFSRRFL